MLLNREKIFGKKKKNLKVFVRVLSKRLFVCITVLAHFDVFECAFGFSSVRNKYFDLVSDWNGGSARGNSMGNHCGTIKGLSWELRPLQVIAEALCRSRGLQDRLGAPGEAIRLINLVCSFWFPPLAAAYGPSSGQVPSASTSIEAFTPFRESRPHWGTPQSLALQGTPERRPKASAVAPP